MNVYQLINETSEKLSQGEALTDAHLLTALIALANFGMTENRNNRQWVNHGGYYDKYQQAGAMLDEIIEWSRKEQTQ